MNTCKKLIRTLSLLLAGLSWFLITPISAQNIVTGEGTHQVLQLGSIQVTGEPMVLKTLQIIKQGLREPYSNDPKLANVVVCRLNYEAGSHLTSTLLCATNRIFSEGRDAMHVAGANAVGNESNATCNGSGCTTVQDEQIFATLNETINSLPGHYLHASVNAAALHELLEKIPNPAPVRPATPAPAAGTQT
ncbi:MAG: hypothetical protein WBR29_07020 [Gammaproteobacteria bacterium]